jgi:putative transposase
MNARRKMVTSTPSLSMRQQCELLRVNRSSLYYKPAATDPEELVLMRRIDELHLKYPFYGSRRLAQELSATGERVNRKHVQRLMRLLGIESVSPKPNTSKPSVGHTKYPYLLRNIDVTRVDQVWCADITYIPMARGFLYLVAIMDWHSRKVLSWNLSNTMDPSFCVDALSEALQRFGTPEIFNTDQGSQFTSESFTEVLKAHNVKISMDGKGRWVDNVFIERLWRSLKYEEVYLHAYANFEEANARIGSYFEFYNTKRRHMALGNQSPSEFYRTTRKAA